ncbi:MAG TPA: hypothetical protein VFL70_08645, partial [Bacteroidia bacterium]|nr:hypothetical protein [Bacteroidia bacterium]
MNLERVNKILLIGSAISWLTIFIDGLTEEGLMIFFLTDGLYTSSTINKGISLLSIIAVITIPFLIWKKNVNRFIIVVVYLLLAIKLLKHFTDLGGYYSWIYKPKTFIPTMLFILFSITSIFIYPIYKILNQQKKKGSRHEFDAR